MMFVIKEVAERVASLSILSSYGMFVNSKSSNWSPVLRSISTMS